MRDGREVCDGGGWTFYLDDHTAAVVANESSNPEFGGDPVYEWTESHALDDSVHLDSNPT